MRARVTRADGRLRQSLSDYHRALGFAPDDRRVLMEIAELYHELNEPQKALATVHTLADTWPLGEEPQRVLLLEGLAYTKLGRYKEATESLAAANLVDQPTPEIFFRLAEAELLAGHPQRAFEAAEQALRLDPRHRPSLELLQRVDVAGKAGQGLTR
jgi:tetratricopeptide (TPR) repeat protein